MRFTAITSQFLIGTVLQQYFPLFQNFFWFFLLNFLSKVCRPDFSDSRFFPENQVFFILHHFMVRLTDFFAYFLLFRSTLMAFNQLPFQHLWAFGGRQTFLIRNHSGYIIQHVLINCICTACVFYFILYFLEQCLGLDRKICF